MKRPNYHFTLPNNWINDPNGLVYIDGEYHLFYQHYPKDIVWGPMHWGHAVSMDLLHWEHKEIALYPDELGYIFSGSCIYDRENVSDLGTLSNPPLLAFFTHHDPDSGRQQQSIAYSLDKEHFIKYKNNPVIPNAEKKDFRDPKVFENPVKGGFTMAVAAGCDIEFYHSYDLLNWNKTGSFTPGEHGYGGICECPDCFPLETDEGIQWVLIVSMCLSDEDVLAAIEKGECASAHMMQYYIGKFDGETFIDMVCEEKPLMVDFGLDNYAAVTFSNCSQRIILGWGENWNYVKKTPANEYRGKMTIARKLSLRKTRFGYRLCSEPINSEQFNHGQNISIQNEDVIEIKDSSFGVKIPYISERKVSLFTPCGKKLKIQIEPDKIIVDRSECGVYAVTQDKEILKKNYDVLYSPRFTPEGGVMKILFDEGYFEIFAEDGLAVFSLMTF